MRTLFLAGVSAMAALGAAGTAHAQAGGGFVTGGFYGVQTPSQPTVIIQGNVGGGGRWGQSVGGRWYGGVRAPGGWNAYRRPARGWRLPSYWIQPDFYIGDYNNYHLSQPPQGYSWTRYYDDAVLIDAQGNVWDAVSGIDWSMDPYAFGGPNGYAQGYPVQTPYNSAPGPIGRMPPPVAYAPPAPVVQQQFGSSYSSDYYAQGGYSSGYGQERYAQSGGWIPGGTTTTTVTIPQETTTTTTTEIIEEVYEAPPPPPQTVIRRIVHVYRPVYRAPVRRVYHKPRVRAVCCPCGCR